MPQRLRILFVSFHRPWPATFGTRIRVLAALAALESFAEVDFCFLGDLGEHRNHPFYKNRNVVAELPWSAGIHRFPYNLLARRLADHGEWAASYVPHFEKLFRAAPEVRERFHRVLREGRYQVVFLVRPESLWYLDPDDSVPVIVDIDDVKSLHALEALQNSSSLIRSMPMWLRRANVLAAEHRLYERVAAALVCSDDDRKRLGYPKVKVFPNPIPNHGQQAEPVAEGSSDDLLFIGTLKYKPNREAVLWFAKEVLPLIRAVRPQVTFSIVGGYRDEDVQAIHSCQSVRLLGRVDDIRPLIRNCALEVAPIQEGLGTRIKIVEALSFGKCVVATNTGAFGITLGETEGLFREDSPGEFARRCIQLMDAPGARNKLGSVAKSAVYDRYGEACLASTMQSLVQGVLGIDKLDSDQSVRPV